VIFLCGEWHPTLLWPDGWMDEDATWYGNRHRRRPHCIRRVPSAPRKGHSTPHPLLGPCLLWPRSPISATAELLFQMSCPVLFFFLQQPSRTVRPVFMLYGPNDVVPPKDGPFGVRTITDIFGGKCAPNAPKRVVNRRFQAKVKKILKLALLSKLLHRFQPNFAQ